MATTETAKNALAEQKQPKSLQLLIQESAKELGKALPEHMRPERLVRIALTCIRMTPKLANCSPESFLGALFTAAQLGIEPIAGRAYLLPFFNSKKKPDGSWHKVMEAQFVLGYKGLSELFYRHEKAVELAWSAVHANDEFEFELGSDARLVHRPVLNDKGPVTAYWVQATLKNGAKPFKVMSLEDCMAHGQKHSKTYDKKKGEFYEDSPWRTNPDSMCLKTVLIQLCKVLPLSFELQTAIEQDESSREYRKGIGNALDVPSTTNWQDHTLTTEQLGQPAAADEPKVDEPEIPFGE
jgi:recombination protein RecT